MRFRWALPRLFASTVDAEKPRDKPVLDGSIPMQTNVWRVPPQTVALCGRPAVWFAFDIRTPRCGTGLLAIPSMRLVWEQDFGGHLYLVVVGDDPALAYVLEGGPNSPGTGALVPFGYPEDGFFQRGLIDFDPVEVEPPFGMSKAEFVERALETQRAYDGDQEYLAVEIPFLRVGRDSNSYAIGLLLAAGVDIRKIPKPYRARRFEWAGYPGAEDPVHRANFGLYLGEPHSLRDGTMTCAYHDERGDVSYVCVAGAPHGTATLPDGAVVDLDEFGRRVLPASDAKACGLPLMHTAPPPHVAGRVRFPPNPPKAGANITLVVDGISTPLLPGREYTGRIVARNDALGLALLRTEEGSFVALPLIELGVELRDPKRVDAALRVGSSITVGLHRDRYPKLHVYGEVDVARSPSWVVRYGGLAGAVVAAAFVAGVAAFALQAFWRR